MESSSHNRCAKPGVDELEEVRNRAKRIISTTRENPSSKEIILDELEKAHRDLQHCLYDILDTATCREKSSGRMVDFSGCVFFATCNAGVEALRKIRQESGNDQEDDQNDSRSRPQPLDDAKFWWCTHNQLSNFFRHRVAAFGLVQHKVI